MKDVLECDAEILDELTTSRGELRVRPASLSPDKGHQVNFFFRLFIDLCVRSKLTKRRMFTCSCFNMQIYPNEIVEAGDGDMSTPRE